MGRAGGESGRAAGEARGSAQAGVNVGSTERQVSTIAGAALALLGVTRGSLGGLVVAGLGGALVYRGMTGHSNLYQALGVSTIEHDQDAARPEEYFQRGIHVVATVTILKSREELYPYWRQLENLPRIMRYLKSVTVVDGQRSHWVASGPAGASVEWDAEIINEEPNSLIAWRSLGGAEVHNSGSVRFVPAPGDRGTEVRVTLDYIPPAGQVGRWVAKLFGKDPEAEIREDLRNFKRKMEAGEQLTTRGQPRGTCGGSGRHHLG